VQEVVIINNSKIVLIKHHLDVTINHVQFNQVNVQLDYHVQRKIKSYVLIILVQTVFFNVKFQMNVLMESCVQINHVDHL